MIKNWSLSIFLLLVVNILFSQVTLTVEITDGFSGSTCTDGFFGGPPELHWRVDIAGQGYTTYPQAGICYTDVPNVQFNEMYNCVSAYPDSLEICFRALEDDGALCVLSESCLEEICENFWAPDPGMSYDDTLRIIDDGVNDSWGWVAFTVTATGSFPEIGNDSICDAVDLGVLPSGGTLGDITLSNFNNFCATNTDDPTPPWTNDQGVWFEFTTGPNPGVTIDINAANDPGGLGDQIDLQLALYASNTNLCTGTLTLIEEDHDPLIFDEELSVNCLMPNTTYFLLVDGEMGIGGSEQEGYFGLEIVDNGIAQAADDICDAENLGAIPDGGSVGTAALSQSNVCATNTTDPTVTGGTNQGVWYEFETPSSGNISIDANSDLPFPIGDDAVDLRLFLFSSSDGLCTGTLNLIADSYVPGIFNEDLSVTCLYPNQTYWLMVDGSALNVDGIFDVTISDVGVVAVSDSVVDVQTACGSYTWIDGNTYTTSVNDVSLTFTNAAGCDSIVTLDLTINNSTTGTDVLTGCDSLTWIDGITYYADEFTATHTLTNAAGCDSVVTLNLTMNYANTGVDVVTACDNYTWIDGVTYTADEFAATHTLTNAAGCDSVITLNLTMNYSSSGVDVITTCDSLTWIDGVTYYADEFAATHTLTNAVGCDSIVTLNLTMNYSNTGIDVIMACDSLTWTDGITYYADNFTATDTFTNVMGCDSVVTLNLTMNYANAGVDVLTGCDSLTWIDGITYYADEFAATHTLTNAAGCDSVVTLNLTMNYSSTGVDVLTGCDSLTWIDGITYYADEFVATHTLTNAVGCDSVVTLNLTMNYANTGVDIISACDSLIWTDGITYYADNFTATDTFTNVMGCDSVVTLNLTMNYANTGVDIVSTCDSLIWTDGITYYADNFTATDTFTNVMGCDSVVTLNLTINYSTTGVDVITACDSYTWIDGETYTADEFVATHVLTNAAGCDSVVTLNLTMNYSSTGIDEITACDSYTWIDGITYTADEFVATHTLTNAVGCDSIVTLNLTLNNSNTGIDIIEACDSYTWIDGVTYTSDEFGATHTLINAAGCDSVVTLNLTIHTSPTVGITASETVICFGETVTLSGTGADTYTWDLGVLDGVPFNPGLIGGETYTVTGTTAEGCEGTASINIVINDCDPVFPEFTINGALCIGSCVQVQDLSTGGPITDWAWTFGTGIDPETSTDQNPEICLEEAGTYMIELTTTNINGSTYSTTDEITVHNLPAVNATLDTIIQIGGEANLIAVGSLDGGDYLWSPENTIECPDCAVTIANPIEDQTYEVVFTDENGCIATDTVMVLVNFVEGIGVPEAFSPNDDGNNDVLYVNGFGIVSLYFVVYNRYGEKVFESYDQAIGWDGTFRGYPENPGVFTWVLEYDLVTGRRGKQSGNTTLVR